MFTGVRERREGRDFAFFVVSCWSLWYNRNKIVHEQKSEDPLDTLRFVRNYIEIVEMFYSKSGNLNSMLVGSNAIWEAPTNWTIKVNFDASIKLRLGGGGIGIVGRVIL